MGSLNRTRLESDYDYTILGQVTPDDVRWMQDGNCVGMDTDIFFPDDKINNSTTSKIRAICHGCPVADRCLQYAQDNHLHTGWFGGRSPMERRAMRSTSARRLH